MSNLPHRKRVRHFHEPGDVHELTFSCYQRRPLLTNRTWCGWFCESVDRACARHRFGLLAYVIMPEHVHLVVVPFEPEPNVPRSLSDIKHRVSIKVKRALKQRRSPLLARLTLRQRPGVRTFRFWQEGPGYDLNLTTPAAVMLAIAYIHETPVRRGLCRKAVGPPFGRCPPWSSAPRLINDLPPDRELPRLVRFEPELMAVT